MLFRPMVTTLLALALSGCGAAAFSVHDLKPSPSGDTLYVLARSTNVSRNFCATLGGDVALAEGRLASANTGTMRIGRVTGCHTVRHIIVCSEGDTDCITHEERHRDDGNFQSMMREAVAGRMTSRWRIAPGGPKNARVSGPGMSSWE